MELLANIFGAIGNMLLALLEAFAWLFPWRRRAKAAPGLPEGTILNIVAALKPDKDAAKHLPKGWRGFYAGLDEALPDITGTMPTGAPLQLTLDPERSRRQEPILVALADRSTSRIGYLPRRRHYGDSIDLGRVLCWFAKRERTLLDRNAAVVFVAVYDP